jgi:tetratricopeptide (TPR) repeat protein
MARQRIHTRDSLAMREASSMLDRALEISPDYAPALAQKALASYLLSNALGAYGDAEADEVVPDALALVDRALEIDGDLAEALAVKGLLVDYKGQFEDAVDLLERALELNPTMSNAANWLAASYASLGRRQETIPIYERILELDPMYGPAFGNLVSAYGRTGLHDQAEALISRIEGIVGENDETWQARGGLYIMRGEMAKSGESFRRSLGENPNASITQLWHGFAALNVADYESALEYAIPAHRIYALAEQGYVDEALAQMETFNHANDFPPRVLYEFGFLLNRRGMSQAYLDHITSHFGSVETVLAEHPATQGWGTEYLGELAYAYRAAGNMEMFDRLVALMGETLDVHRRNGNDNWVTHFSELEYQALQGAIDEAIQAMRVTLDSGFVVHAAFESPVFDGLRDDQRFQALLAEHDARVDEERAKLGLPPYRPVPVTDEEKEPSSFVN